MRMLAFDTSTEACSVALHWDGEETFKHQVAPRAHGDLILPMIDALLRVPAGRLSQLDAIAVGCGPGGFTGVRIAIGAAQGLALGADVPLILVSTLAAMAQGAYRERGAQKLLCAIDARMGEVYFGAFVIVDGLAVAAAGGECVTPPETVPLPDGQGWHGCGTGFGSYDAALKARLAHHLLGSEPDRFPHALDILALGAESLRCGNTVAPEHAMPVYLRDKVADIPAARRTEVRD